MPTMFPPKFLANHTMTLRTKTFLMVGTALVGLLIMLLLVSYKILLTGFTDLEYQSTEKSVNRLVNVLTDEVYGLYTEAKDYAMWDEMYEYMSTQNQDFLSSNFSADTLSNLHLNIVVLIDRQEHIVAGINYNSNTYHVEKLPADYFKYFEHNPLFTYNQNTQGQIVGFMRLSGELLLIAGRPILPSQGGGDSRGTLVMGRFLNSEELQRLKKLTDLSLHLQLLAPNTPNTLLPEELAKARSLLSNKRTVVQTLTENSIAGYVFIKDLYQQPAALLRVELPREIYQAGLVSLRYLSAVVFIVALAFALFILWLFERLVLARLAVLSHEVKQIRSTDEFLTVTVVGQDELSQLAITINEMLTALQTSHARLRQSQASLAEAQRIAHLGNWQWDMTNNHFECSDEVYRILGLLPQSDSLTYDLFLNHLHPDDWLVVTRAINQAIQDYQPFSIQHRIIQQNQNQRFIHTQGEILPHNFGDGGSGKGGGLIIGTLQDITEQKLAQAETLRLLEENRFLIHRSIEIQEDERRLLARELHDELGQCLTAIQADAEAITELAQEETLSKEVAAKIQISADAILTVSAHIYDVVHTLMRQLRPSGLDELGLVKILQDLVKTWQTRHPETRCTFTTQGELDQLGETVNITLYRILQECLTNIAKYANASQVSLSLTTDVVTQQLVLNVQDNGKGFVATKRPGGLGLIGIRERAQALEGHLQIDSSPGQGVNLRLTLPLAEEYQRKRRKMQ